ncbi:translation initiation factor IF-2 [Campylobacter corcagiensis]|uniref:Translation initiation factor IF-2 n=1 Tax=Campylobacter corcagiensis TaxID=1448857 RepID=A0A7M1LGF9_9BACT|nr:translation initiation factor IF-2 [Campylobacter corcagiensis]QKF64291.1 translation initiation factor IF-2 [Campylobacter corcagiensis]QOQ87520.1 translation initiation factor IF-2 [Campylobacter corcagiensis]
MAEVQISDIALELGYDNKEIIKKAHEMGLKKVKAANSKVSVDDAEAIYNYIQTGELPKKKKTTRAKKNVVVDEDIDIVEPKKEELEAKKPVKKAKPDVKKPSKEPAVEVEKTEPAKQDVKKEKIVEAKKSTPTESENLKPKEPTKVEDKIPGVTKIKKESVASSLGKRKGIVILKKKKEDKESNTSVKKPSTKLNVGLDTLFSNAETSLNKKKKEKQKIHQTPKREGVKKVELLDDRGMADINFEDDNEVVLPDLTVKPIQVEERKETKKQQIYKNSQASYTNQDNAPRSISRGSRKKHKKTVKVENNQEIKSLDIPKEIRVYEFADKLGKSPSEIISKLFILGLMVTKNDFLDEDAMEILASEFDIEINIIDEAEEFDYVSAYNQTDDDEKDLKQRAPVVTIMGHVDHGKTSLLDYIRNSRVATGEAGGITQHVGAYMVTKNNRAITFIDTPGHEAFTAMRERGAQVTDIVIIIVAADDGVKPQTKEAVAHAKAAGVPIIIAINKMDKPTANPDKVKTGLSELDIMPVDWGGSYEFVPISAKTGMGVDDLLEIVLLQADLLELKANPNRSAKATVIESSLQKGVGTVATIIVENGTLRVGDNVVVGSSYGRVRAITDDSGKALKDLKPGECGVIIGLNEVPESGETLVCVENEKVAREYAKKIYDHNRALELSRSTKVSLEELGAKIAEGELKTLPVIVKADVGGSLEAIKASLEKLRNDEVKVDIIHSGVGGITQNDISLASASENCVILGFNIRPTGDVKESAKQKGVTIKTYNVIYSMLDDVKAVLGGLMSPIISEEEIGQAEIRQVINVPKVGQIAGCMVTDGKIVRGAKIRVIREGIIKFEGEISSLKRFKDDAKEVAKGFECGVGIVGYDDMQVGDFIESFIEKEQKVVL